MSLGLGVGQAEQTHENGDATLVALGHPHRTAGEGTKDFFHRQGAVAGAGFQFIELGIKGGRVRREKAGEDRLDKRILGPEMIVNRRQVDTGLAGYHSE